MSNVKSFIDENLITKCQQSIELLEELEVITEKLRKLGFKINQNIEIGSFFEKLTHNP